MTDHATPLTPVKREVDLAQMVRVNQAGEYGATRIYAGQRAVMGDTGPEARAIAGMAAQEEVHRAFFDKMMAERGVRPTALQPFWNIAGFGLGAVTALIGPKAAMACTVAVETEIDRHYSDQLEELGDSQPELSAAISKFRDEELEHKDRALAAGAEEAIGYPVMSAVIRMGCRAAIALSKRI
jgi:3-demethoxyubiquinol 3-hydroxylase